MFQTTNQVPILSPVHAKIFVHDCTRENVDVLLHHRIYLLGGLDQRSKHMKEAYSYFESTLNHGGHMETIWTYMEHRRETNGKIWGINKAKRSQLQIQRSLRAPESLVQPKTAWTHPPRPSYQVLHWPRSRLAFPGAPRNHQLDCWDSPNKWLMPPADCWFLPSPHCRMHAGTPCTALQWMDWGNISPVEQPEPANQWVHLLHFQRSTAFWPLLLVPPWGSWPPSPRNSWSFRCG